MNNLHAVFFCKSFAIWFSLPFFSFVSFFRLHPRVPLFPPVLIFLSVHCFSRLCRDLQTQHLNARFLSRPFFGQLFFSLLFSLPPVFSPSLAFFLFSHSCSPPTRRFRLQFTLARELLLRRHSSSLRLCSPLLSIAFAFRSLVHILASSSRIWLPSFRLDTSPILLSLLLHPYSSSSSSSPPAPRTSIFAPSLLRHRHPCTAFCFFAS